MRKFVIIALIIFILSANSGYCAVIDTIGVEKANELLSKLRSKKTKVIIVSNEVGLGIVPAHKLGRDFRDIAGVVNQLVAKEADEVFFMISGIPWRVKCKK